MNTYLFQYEFNNEQYRFALIANSTEEAAQRVSQLCTKAHLLPTNQAETANLAWYRILWLRFRKNHRFYDLGPV